MRASPSLSQLWQPHSGLCHLCRVCEQQRSFTPGFRRKELHATEGAVEVRRARHRLEDTVTDERDEAETQLSTEISLQPWVEDALVQLHARKNVPVNSKFTPWTLEEDRLLLNSYGVWRVS